MDKVVNKEEKLNILKELGGISEEDYDELLKKGIKDIKREFEKLNKAFLKDDIESARMAAHAIKGIAGNYRIKSVQGAAKALEQALRGKEGRGILKDLIDSLSGDIENL